MKQNSKWLSKWNIKLHECPNTNVEIKKFVLEKFRTIMWTKQVGRKKTHYIQEFNPTWEHDEKNYLRIAIKGKARLLVTQLRIGSHHLRCETGRWVVAKEAWEQRTCISCNKGVVQTKSHFIIECVAYDDIRTQYEDNLKVDNLNELFKETRLLKTVDFLVKIYKRWTNIEKNLKMVKDSTLGPISWWSYRRH